MYLLMDTISFDRLFMRKLERTNGIKKRLTKIKLDNGYLLYLIFWLKIFIYQDLKYKFSKFSSKLQPLPLKD